ncbi:MAG: DoxX family protein [Chloroflexi bacterium]|jgi:putative oxidoreductase|nr:DoxX family protein [Chloroflexota bacterium]
MTDLKTLVEKWPACAPYLLSVLRIAAAFMFILPGTMKLFAFPAGIPPTGGTAPLMSEAGLAGVLETVGGVLLLLGLFTRPVAFLLAGEMAVAYFQVAFPQGFWPILNQGMPAALFCFIWLYLSAAGAGPWSLDARRGAVTHLAGERQASRDRVAAGDR